jgi:prevent-host-death family protein
MSRAQPETETMKVTDARAHWSEVVNAVFRGEKRVVLEKAGLPVAAVISAEDLKRLRRYDAQREADFAVLDRIAAAFADVPEDELERETARALAEARAELQAEREQTKREQAQPTA